MKKNIDIMEQMKNKPFLEKIIIYPIKSLDGVSVTKAKILQSGALEYDREFAIVDRQDKRVNGKRTEKIHMVRSSFDVEARTVTLHAQQTNAALTFHLDNERGKIDRWLSDFFGFSVKLVQNTWEGFPDDRKASGPTVVSAATLKEVSAWFSGIDEDNIRARFRANLEIGGVPTFWEDRLFNESGVSVKFEVGQARFAGSNPCQRCVVPSRDPLTGVTYPEFQKIFMARRKETMPSWAAASRFDHFYRLCINTTGMPSEAGKTVRVGDEIKRMENKN